MVKSKNYHVVPNDGNGWKVIKEGADRPSVLTQTKQPAINMGINLAKTNKGELFIHGQNGQIQNRNTYGKDPFPPKG